MSLLSDEQIQAFSKMLQSLHGSYLGWVADSRGDRRRDKRRRLNREATESFGVVPSQKLLVVRKRERLEFAPRELLFLKPPSSGMVLPALKLDGDLQQSKLRIQMVLFTYDGTKLAAIGYRFETPEEKGEKHLYYHAQMIRRLRPPELPGVPPGLPIELPGGLDWLPDSVPALPLSAKTPISLFLGVLMALYGLEDLKREWAGQGFLQDLSGDVEDLKGGCGHS